MKESHKNTTFSIHFYYPFLNRGSKPYLLYFMSSLSLPIICKICFGTFLILKNDFYFNLDPSNLNLWSTGLFP